MHEKGAPHFIELSPKGVSNIQAASRTVNNGSVLSCSSNDMISKSTYKHKEGGCADRYHKSSGAHLVSPSHGDDSNHLMESKYDKKHL
jgi:hypothetical protein